MGIIWRFFVRYMLQDLQSLTKLFILHPFSYFCLGISYIITQLLLLYRILKIDKKKYFCYNTRCEIYCHWIIVCRKIQSCCKLFPMTKQVSYNGRFKPVNRSAFITLCALEMIQCDMAKVLGRWTCRFWLRYWLIVWCRQLCLQHGWDCWLDHPVCAPFFKGASSDPQSHPFHKLLFTDMEALVPEVEPYSEGSMWAMCKISIV